MIGTLKRGSKEDADLILDVGAKSVRNGYDLGPGSPHSILSALPQSPPLMGPQSSLETEQEQVPVPGPCPSALRDNTSSPEAGLPRLFWAGAPPHSEAVLPRGLGSLRQSSPWKSSMRACSCEPGQHCETDAYLAWQASTRSAESTRGCNTHGRPQFPELMSQFSFSISTRFLKASFCYNLLSQLGVAEGEGGEFLCQENICFAGQQVLRDGLEIPLAPVRQPLALGGTTSESNESRSPCSPPPWGSSFLGAPLLTPEAWHPLS